MFYRGLQKATLIGVLLGIFVPALAPLSSSALANTNSSLNIQISPLPLELSTVPGSSVSSSLRVRNGGSQPETLKISLDSVKQQGPTGQINIGSFLKNNPLPSWVHFSQTVFNAPPGQWLNIGMTINVPKTAAYAYAFGVRFQLANQTKGSADKTAVNGAADIFVLLNATAPGEYTQAAVTSFTTTQKVYEFLPATFNVVVHNSGNSFVAPYGNIFIDRGKKQIATLDINSGLGNILPESNRTYSATWSKGFPYYKTVTDVNGQDVLNKKGLPVEKLDWSLSNLSNFRIGHYTAHLIMVYSNGKVDVPINAIVGFWVIPWRILLVFLVILSLMGFGLYSIFRNIRGKKPPKIKTPKKPKGPNPPRSGGKSTPIDYRRREQIANEPKRRPISRYPSH